MMYYALMIGKGDGCDYTIACNKNFKRLEATTIVEAREDVENILMDDDVDRFESIQILSVNSFIDFDIEEFKNFQLKEDVETEEYKEYLRLREKFEG